MKTVANFKDSLTGLLTGINLNTQVSGLNGALERAARQMAETVYIPETMGSESIVLYDGVYDYEAPETIYGTEIIDLAPQGNSRNFLDYTYKKPLTDFDREKGYTPSGAQVTFKYVKGTGIVRIASARSRARAVLDPMTDDEGWTAAGSASGLAVDQTVFYDYPAALRFTLTGSSTGTLTKAISSQKLSDYEDVGVAFLAVRIPDGSTVANLTSVTLRLGSSASAYNEVSTTQGFLGAWVAGEWLLLAFDFSSASESGTPDWSAIDYAQIRIAHTAGFTNFRVGGLWISLPSPQNIIYQTCAFFLASGGSPSASITNDNDSIILNDSAYVIYEHIAAKVIALQQSGGVVTDQIRGFDAVLEGSDKQPGLLENYRANNPSEGLRTVGNYYDV